MRRVSAGVIVRELRSPAAFATNLSTARPSATGDPVREEVQTLQSPSRISLASLTPRFLLCPPDFLSCPVPNRGVKLWRVGPGGGASVGKRERGRPSLEKKDFLAAIGWSRYY